MGANCLSTILIVTKAETALVGDAIGPESTAEINVGLWEAGVGEEEPDAEYWLGEDVENSVGDDLTINGDGAGAVGNTPDTEQIRCEQVRED